MIRLLELLLEISNQPKAIFLAGSAGGGKTSTYKSNPEFPTQIDNLLPSSYEVINVDIPYEELLKKSGLSNKMQKDFTPDELAQAGKLMGKAQKITKEKYNKALESLQNLIIDGTGAFSGPLLKKKQQLEDLGYKTMMVMIYTSPLTSLERNLKRGEKGGRSLLPSIVLRTWRDVNKNIDTYKQIFGDNMVLINNDPENATTGFDTEYIKKTYFDTSKAKGKEKSPEEMAKSKAEKEQMNKDIETIIQNIPSFDTVDQAKSKITNFINK